MPFPSSPIAKRRWMKPRAGGERFTQLPRCTLRRFHPSPPIRAREIWPACRPPPWRPWRSMYLCRFVCGAQGVAARGPDQAGGFDASRWSGACRHPGFTSLYRLKITGASGGQKLPAGIRPLGQRRRGQRGSIPLPYRRRRRSISGNISPQDRPLRAGARHGVGMF